MTEGKYDVIIVGAGPAGSTCAWFAARAGLRVALVDEAIFPRDKVCGDALSRTKVLPLLREMGLIRDGRNGLSGSRCTELLLVSSSGAKFLIPSPSHWDPIEQAHWICRRRDFDAWLLSSARSHVDVIEGVKVTGVLREHRQIVGIRGQERVNGRERTVRSRVVVGADGMYSTVAQHAGLHPGDMRRVGIALRGYFQGLRGLTNQMEFHYVRRLLPGCLWIFPSGDGCANVGLGVFKKDLDRMGCGVTELFWRVVAEQGHLNERFKDATLLEGFRGWPLPGWVGRRRLSGDGVLLIGDAAWLVDPVTGEGIGNAMLSGKLAARVIVDALRAGVPSAAVLARYDRLLWETLGRELRLARLLQRLVSRPWVTETAIRLGAANGWPAEVMRNIVLTPKGKRRALSVHTLAGILRSPRRRDGTPPKALSTWRSHPRRFLTSLVWFYRLRTYKAQVPAQRALLFTLFGYAIAARWNGWLLVTNLAAVGLLFMFFGAYNNYWDWRSRGEQNSTQAVIDRRRLSPGTALLFTGLPWLGIVPLLLAAGRLGMSEMSMGLFWLLAVLGFAYMTPRVRLKDRPLNFFMAPLWACLLFLQGYTLQGAPWGRGPVLILCGILFLFQCQAELLHRLDEHLHQQPDSPASRHLLRRLQQLPVLVFCGSLATVAATPLFLNTSVWSIVRLRSVRRLSIAQVSALRQQLWHPVWSLYEFAVYAAFGLLHKFS